MTLAYLLWEDDGPVSDKTVNGARHRCLVLLPSLFLSISYYSYCRLFNFLSCGFFFRVKGFIRV